MTDQFPALRADWRSANGVHVSPVRKILIHTTEGSTVAGAQSVYNGRFVHPHVTYNPANRNGVQHVLLDRAAAALKTVSRSYNRDGVIQVEVVGFAGQTHTYPDWWYRNLYEDVIKPILDYYPDININNYPPFRGVNDSYGKNSLTRLGTNDWLMFNGLLGHQHVPENSHWDPGQFDAATLVSFHKEDEDLTPEQDKMLREVHTFLTDRDHPSGWWSWRKNHWGPMRNNIRAFLSSKGWDWK